MTDKDPIEGFHITGYDEDTQTLTISVDPKILGRSDQEHALAIKAIDILTDGPSVESVIFVPRN